MSNSKDKKSINAIDGNDAFDESIHDFDDNSNEKSELRKQKKLAPRGQKVMMLFVIFVSLLLVGWLAYGMINKQKVIQEKSKEKRQEEQANIFSTTPTKDFTQAFSSNIESEPTTVSQPITSTEKTVPAPIGLVNTNNAVIPPIYKQAPIQPVNVNNGMPIKPVKSEKEQALERQLNSSFTAKNSNTESSSGSSARLGGSSSRNNDSDDEDSLASKLNPTAIKGVAAQRMMNRDYMISAGSMIDCALETKFNSTTVGMLSCNVTRNIYSASGRVILIDRGSKIIGQYKGGLQQGQARVFVLWTRVETPQGVIMNIDSPASGGLGDMGMEGRVNNHFWQRFGGAMLVSVIDGLGKALGNIAASKFNESLGGDNYFQNGMSNDSSSVAEKVIENTINIPPTLLKHQGDRVNVFVSRDLDFSGVYKLD